MSLGGDVFKVFYGGNGGKWSPIPKSLHLGVDHIKIYSHPTNELSKWSGAEEPTVYGWNTKVGAPFLQNDENKLDIPSTF